MCEGHLGQNVSAFKMLHELKQCVRRSDLLFGSFGT